ncbi:MAG: hypothetical protein JXC32_04920, partial [Anaerolineae bacterium]|nr:hypothetical protein [Anaerolineae bacterium]
MKRLVVVLVLLSTACVLPGIVEVPGATPTPVEAPASATAVFPTTTPVVKPRPTYTPTPAPQPTPTLASDPRLEPDDVLLLPQPLSEGDRLSVDVDPSLPPGFVWEDGDEPQITLTLPDGETASTGVAEMGFDNVAQARFYWIDDVPSSPATSSPEDALIDLPEVDGQATYTAVYTLTLTLPPDVPDPNPDNNTLVLRVPVRPRESLSPPEPGAQWAVTETAGFSLHYLTGSAAERDLASIVDAAAQAYDEVIQRFDAMGARDVS